jgi:hypothetical protein
MSVEFGELVQAVESRPHLNVLSAIDFRITIGGEKKMNDYCHSLAVAGSRKLAEILGTHVLDSTDLEGELIANMVSLQPSNFGLLYSQGTG